MVMSSVSMATPVLLLYVYDKNNAVLEYLLSLGKDQGEIFRNYLKASILISGTLLVAESAINILVGLFIGIDSTLVFSVAILAPIMGLAIVSFVTIIMVAFSSLQKERVGSNQPLGIGVGVALTFPTYIVPFVLPEIAIFVELLIVAAIVVLSVATFLSASRLISREKLLP